MTFWCNQPLTQMTRLEWESLCDGCGKCCLHKLQDQDSGQLLYTNVACRLLDVTSARCTHYPIRQRLVPDCLQLTPHSIGNLTWLPASCAYRLLFEGRDLPDWHPLLSGDPDSVRRAGRSVLGWVVSETQVDDIEDYIIDELP